MTPGVKVFTRSTVTPAEGLLKSNDGEKKTSLYILGDEFFDDDTRRFIRYIVKDKTSEKKKKNDSEKKKESFPA